VGAARNTLAERRRADRLVAEYRRNRESCEVFRERVLSMLSNSSALEPYVHSFKSRLKDPSHLREKLLRKMRDARGDGKPFTVSEANLFKKVTDLAGVRLLHLYTAQFEKIHPVVTGLVEEQGLSFFEKPFARTWDDEYRSFFERCGVHTEPSPSMYTSVHYVIRSNSKVERTCELQVRTLFEEVWGEVDHTLNYPKESPVFACREQLRVLARVTSSGTRLVDAIYATDQRHGKRRRRR
jgi:ppGpp synthetase/RelA/SpoT-type nucleotidyltranferase